MYTTEVEKRIDKLISYIKNNDCEKNKRIIIENLDNLMIDYKDEIQVYNDEEDYLESEIREKDREIDYLRDEVNDLEQDVESLQDDLEEALEENDENSSMLPSEALYDQLKIELLQQKWEHIDLEDLEEILKKKNKLW